MAKRLSRQRQACGRRREVVARQTQLLACRLGAIDDSAKGRVFRPILGVPAQMLARDAHTLLLAVERVQRLEMAAQDRADFVRIRRRQQLAGRQVMRDLAEDPRPALRGAADQQAVALRMVEYRACLLRGIDIAVRPDRYRDRLPDCGDRRVFSVALLNVRALPPVHV